MKKLNLFFLMMIVVSFIPSLLFGQLYEVPLDQRIKQSSLIVEGIVSKQTSFRTETGDICTANEVQVVGVFKGFSESTTLTVITRGGTLENELHTWTHMLNLNENDYGIFFLNPYKNVDRISASFEDAFEVYAGLQGFCRFSKNSKQVWISGDVFNIYEDISVELYDYIESQTGNQYQFVNKERDRKISGLRYLFTDFEIEGNSVFFNLYANSLFENRSLYKSGVVLKYNPVFFGDSIASNGNLQFEEFGVSTSSNYQLSKVDVSANEVFIGLEALSTGSFLSEIGVSETPLLKGKLTIENPLVNPDILIEEEPNQLLSRFFENGSIEVYDTVLIESDWKLSGGGTPIIDTIYPLVVAGGIDQVITIEGHNFGTSPNGVLPPADKRILFTPAPEVFPPQYFWSTPIRSNTQYVQWTDTLIQVSVPSAARDVNNPAYAGGIVAAAACTEIIGVLDISATPLTITNSNQSLYVKYSAVNQAHSISGNEHISKTKLSNQNGNGGYYLYYSPQFQALSDSNAVDAFERALETWRCNTFVNFEVWDTTATPPANSCRIHVGSLPIGVSTTTKVTTDLSPPILCGTNPMTWFSYLRSFEMIFSGTVGWHSLATRPNNIKRLESIDLETAALHELGHAQLLWHINNSSNVMYPFITGYKRSLHPNDLEGGKYVVDYSSQTSAPPCNDYIRHTPLSPANCGLTHSVEIVNNPNLFVIYPNPNNGDFWLDVKEGTLDKKIEGVYIYDINGRLVQKHDIISTPFYCNLQNSPSGRYTIIVYDGVNGYPINLIKH